MNRIVLGALGALVLVGLGLFWMQGRAHVEESAPPPPVPSSIETIDPNLLPVGDAADATGPAPPEASELSREQRRFFRYDRDRDQIITRNEMLSSRSKAFRKLDVDGNNLLTFEEWAIATANRFDGMDANRNLELTPDEFATSAPKPRATPSCRC